jgi:hypothetical protein
MPEPDLATVAIGEPSAKIMGRWMKDEMEGQDEKEMGELSRSNPKYPTVIQIINTSTQDMPSPPLARILGNEKYRIVEGSKDSIGTVIK